MNSGLAAESQATVPRQPARESGRGEAVDAARIGAGRAGGALDEVARSGLVVTKAELSLGPEVQRHRRIERVEPHRDGDRFQRLGVPIRRTNTSLL